MEKIYTQNTVSCDTIIANAAAAAAAEAYNWLDFIERRENTTRKHKNLIAWNNSTIERAPYPF